MLFVLSQILVLKDEPIFKEGVISQIKKEFQGYAHVMDWRKNVPKGTKPEVFWKNFWEKAGEKYDVVVVLGGNPLFFAVENIRNRPVLYLENVQSLVRKPPNFAGVYVSVDFYAQIERMKCAVNGLNSLGILAHPDDWNTLSRVFRKENPSFRSVHVFFSRGEVDGGESLKRLKDLGVGMVWIPPTSPLNRGENFNRLVNRAKKYKIGLFTDRSERVIKGAFMSWEPTGEEVGKALTDLLKELQEQVKLYTTVVEDTLTGKKHKDINWRAFLKDRYVIFTDGKGMSSINLSLAKKWKIDINPDCLGYFDEKY